MARIRTVKPDFFRSRSLAKVSIPARLTFAGLWTEADDLGHGPADAEILKGSLWPKSAEVTAADVETHLHELVNTDHISLYVVDDERFFAVTNWAKHQSAAYRRGEAKFPTPDEGNPWSEHESCKIVQPAPPVVQESAGREGKGEEGRGEEGRREPAARLTPHERTATIRAAAHIIVNRRDDDRLTNPAYLAAAVKGLAEDHHDEANRLLSTNPNLTAEQLAEELEPTGQRKLPKCTDCNAVFSAVQGCSFGPAYLECPMVGPLAEVNR